MPARRRWLGLEAIKALTAVRETSIRLAHAEPTHERLLHDEPESGPTAALSCERSDALTLADATGPPNAKSSEQPAALVLVRNSRCVCAPLKPRVTKLRTCGRAVSLPVCTKDHEVSVMRPGTYRPAARQGRAWRGLT